MYAFGELQAANAAPSSAHSNVTFASPETNSKPAAVLTVVAGGPAVMIEPGGVVSTAHVWTAGVASVLPARSVARTRSSCDPTARPVYCLGELQALKAAPSSEHSNVEPASSELKPKLAVVLELAAPGFAPIVVCGALTSYSQVWLAGVASTLPAPSIARTDSVCSPDSRPSGRNGVSHSAYAAPSSEHSNVTSASLEPNVKVASRVGPDWAGPVTIVVSGADTSTVQSHSAGVSSSTPSAFLARTKSVWSPSAGTVTSCGETQATNGPASSAHSKLEPGWSEENAKAAVARGGVGLRTAVDRRLRRRHDAPVAARGGRIGVAGHVDGAHSEGVVAERQPGVLDRRVARLPVAAVERALERAQRLGRRECEARVGAAGDAGRTERDRRVRSGLVDDGPGVLGRDGLDDRVRAVRLDPERVRPERHALVDLRRAADRERRPVERALEGLARQAREHERRVAGLGADGRRGLDRDRLRHLADLPAPLGRRLVGVAGRRDRTHQQLVLAVRQARVRGARLARRVGDSLVEQALERRARVVGGERERRGRALGRLVRTRVDERVERLLRPRVAGGRRVEQSELVHGAHQQLVLAGQQALEQLGRLAGAEAVAVERALEAWRP